jgi:DNA repair protein RadC
MLHEGHRQRMRERFLQDGLNGFAPHEALELLLYYAIPKKDVNPLAHTLLEHFGSLYGVLHATPAELSQVEGIGAYTSALISLIAPLSRIAELTRLGPKPKLSSRGEAENYCLQLLSGLRHEHFYLLALDARMQLLGTAVIGQGNLTETPAYPRLAVEAALKFSAHSVILCHNHPGGSTAPSSADLEATARLAQALSAIDVTVADHIIVAGSQAASLTQMGYMGHDIQSEPAARAADGSL